MDLNRESISKLERYCGNVSVPDIGMFYFAPIDKQAKALFEKANIIWTPGRAMDVGDEFGRLSLGQNCEETAEAVAHVLKIDNIK